MPGGGSKANTLQRVLARGCWWLLLGLIFLGHFVVDKAIANNSDSTGNQFLGASTTAGSESPPRQQSVRTAADAWAPPDIDSVQPPVTNATGCSLEDVVANAGMRIEEFFDNLNRITAIETIQHQTVNRSGNLREPEFHKINYVVSVERTPAGYLRLEEYRGRYPRDSDVSSDDITTSRVFALAAIFDPYYSKGYQMTCEGLGTWQGEPAWQVRFEELPDNPNHLAVLIMNNKTYHLRIRGRAWILADSYQLVRVETDLAQAIPEIHLRLQHQVVEYSLARVSNADAMMLPSSVELYMDFRRHRFYRRHSYTNFELFSVKFHEEFGGVRQ
jgi:hypothetical protein